MAICVTDGESWSRMLAFDQFGGVTSKESVQPGDLARIEFAADTPTWREFLAAKLVPMIAVSSGRIRAHGKILDLVHVGPRVHFFQSVALKIDGDGAIEAFGSSSQYA